jgi:uncharacterized ParB-like nuclease family protein
MTAALEPISVQPLDIDAIRTKGGTQIRVAFNETVAEGYRDEIAAGAEFPPVVVFFDGADYWLADGFHRLIAHAAANRTEIAAEVRLGSRRDAILYAVGANALHGMHRTNADKVNAVMTLLGDPEWSAWSNYDIADRCNVSDEMVRQRRASLPIIGSERRYTNKHGTTSTMNTANIGARPASEFLNNEATWHQPDTYRAPGEETAHPDYRQMDIEEIAPGSSGPPPSPLQFPPGRLQHKLAGGAISDALQIMVDQTIKATPAEVVAALGGELWTDAEAAEKVIPWLTEFMRLVPDEMSKRERTQPYLKGYRRGTSVKQC